MTKPTSWYLYGDMGNGTAREKLITAARELMLSKGYPASTVDEICETAGVSKGSFYHFFKSKEEMGLAVLDDYMARAQAGFLGGDFTRETEPARRMVGFLKQTEANATQLWENGCLLGNFAVDLADTNERIRERVSHIFDRLVEQVADLFEPMCSTYAKKPREEAKRLAELYLSIIEGAIVLSRAHGDWSSLERGLRGFRTYLETLIA